MEQYQTSVYSLETAVYGDLWRYSAQLNRSYSKLNNMCEGISYLFFLLMYIHYMGKLKSIQGNRFWGAHS
jgi:hypothetical protein